MFFLAKHLWHFSFLCSVLSWLSSGIHTWWSKKGCWKGCGGAEEGTHHQHHLATWKKPFGGVLNRFSTFLWTLGGLLIYEKCFLLNNVLYHGVSLYPLYFHNLIYYYIHRFSLSTSTCLDTGPSTQWTLLARLGSPLHTWFDGGSQMSLWYFRYLLRWHDFEEKIC